MMPLWFFIFLGVITVISAFGTVVQRNPVHCLLSLVATLIAIGIFFIALDAPTVGLLQMIVYAGAIMVLFLFVIWLLNLQSELRSTPGHLGLKALAAVFCAVLVAELVTVGWQAPTAAGAKMTVSAGYGSIDQLAIAIFSNYLIAFEATSVLLLAAVVGAVALARRLPPAQAGAPSARSDLQTRPPGGGPREAAAAQAARADGQPQPIAGAHGAGAADGAAPVTLADPASAREGVR